LEYLIPSKGSTERIKTSITKNKNAVSTITKESYDE
jgi:hypothetical protein